MSDCVPDSEQAQHVGLRGLAAHSPGHPLTPPGVGGPGFQAGVW